MKIEIKDDIINRIKKRCKDQDVEDYINETLHNMLMDEENVEKRLKSLGYLK